MSSRKWCTYRFIWGFLVIASISLALIMISLSLNYENSKGATITMTDSMYWPIYSFIYPAISFCDFNKISKKKATTLAQMLESNPKLIPSMVRNLTYLTNLYFAHYSPEHDELIRSLEGVLNYHNLTAHEALKDITPDCNFVQCVWKGRTYECDAMFSKFETPEGMCCSFNSYALKNWTFEGYNAERYVAKPKKLSACGPQTGLRIIFYTDFDDYLVSEYYASGAKLLIHDTYTYPEWNTPTVLLSPLSYTSISVFPSITYTSDETEHLPKEERGCIYPKERQLTHYANYTHENCLNECRIAILLKNCGCVSLYYINPMLESDLSVRICNLTDIPCMSENKPLFMSSVPGFNASKMELNNHNWGEEKGPCDCPPTCEKRDYEIRSTHLKVNLDLLINTTGRHFNLSQVDIFYKNLVGTLIKKDVYKRWHALLGLLGGILGLCIGFSITGAFDLIYYYTLRLLFDLKKGVQIDQKKTRKTNPGKEEEKIIQTKKIKGKIKLAPLKINKIKFNIDGMKIKNLQLPKFSRSPKTFPYLE